MCAETIRIEFVEHPPGSYSLWVREQDRGNREIYPRTDRIGQGDQGDKARHEPSILCHCNETSIVDELRYSGNDQYGHTSSDNVRNAEQVCLDDREPELSEREREILSDGTGWNTKQEAENVEGPHVIVFGAIPDLSK